MMEGSDPRRTFPRIFLVGIHDLKELIGAKVEWDTGQRTDVLDMSFTGMAVVKPTGLAFEKDKMVNVQLLLGDHEPQSIRVVLIRETEKIFGVQFSQLSQGNLAALDGFLSDKLLGKNLRAVSSKFFNQKHKFDLWLHGPNNTNLYIWLKDHHIHKAVLELFGRALVYDLNDFHFEKIDGSNEADDYVLFPTSPKKPSQPTDLREFMSRALMVLSQIEEAPAPVWNLINLIKEKLE